MLRAQAVRDRAEPGFIRPGRIGNEPEQVGSETRGILRQQLRERGRIPTSVFEVRECNAALQHVMLGSGVSVLPRVPMADNNPRLVLLPIIDDPGIFTRTVYLSWKKDRPLGPAAQHVRDAALATGASVRS